MRAIGPVSVEHCPIVSGMATILWALAWADHVEREECRSLSGVKIEEAMPPIGEMAYRFAHRLAGRYEQANGCPIEGLMFNAEVAEQAKTPNRGDLDPERFGECLAYMALGYGVSWFDDHAEFKMVQPRFDCDLEGEVSEACESRKCVEARADRDTKRVLQRFIFGAK